MINKLDITVGVKNGRSFLKDSYYTRPFRVADIGEDKSDPSLYLMIMSSSPGILDKDYHDINIVVEPNARLQLQTQSYQRLYKMIEGAKQHTKITLLENSEISYIQHPIVPHQDSIFSSQNQVYLSTNCTYTYSEIITCGRKHSGEEFKFIKFQNLTEIYHNHKLILKDNILLEPSKMEIHQIGQLEGYTHQGTFIHVKTNTVSLEQHITSMYKILETENDIVFGISQTQPNIIVIRMLGNGGEQLFNAFKKTEKYLWDLSTVFL